MSDENTTNVAVVLEKRANAQVEKAKALTITTVEQQSAAGDELVALKGLEKEIGTTFDPIVEAAHKTHKEAVAQRSRHLAPVTEAMGIIKGKMSTFQIAEQKRIDDENRELERQRQLKEAEKLQQAQEFSDAGMPEVADELLNQAVEEAPPLVQEAPKVAGVAFITAYSAEVVDLMALVKAVAAGTAPIAYLEANTVALNGAARALKQSFMVPGVKLVSSPKASVRG